jgi:hypothetical protein
MTKDVAQFFQDVYFDPPNGRPATDFLDNQGFEADPATFNRQDGEELPPEERGQELLKPEDMDITDQINVSGADPHIWSDYYMFHDPLMHQMDGAGGNPLTGPASDMANTLNVTYKKKDLSDVTSASDDHLENLEQAPATYPKHAGVRSTMEPDNGSAFDLINASRPQDPNQDSGEPQPGNSALLAYDEIVLEDDTFIEGVVYPAGTILTRERS